MLGNVLFYGSIPAFALYFYLFQRVFGLLDSAERKRFIQEAGRPIWRTILAVLPIPLVFIIQNDAIRLALVMWFLAQSIFDQRKQDKDLDRLGFAADFRDGLKRVSVYANIVVLMFGAGVLLRGGRWTD